MIIEVYTMVKHGNTVINTKKEYKSHREYVVEYINRKSTFQRKTDFNGKISERNKSFNELTF